MKVPFNKPYLTGNEAGYINEALLSGKVSGDGHFTKKCHRFFEDRYHFKKCLLTTSCTDALEMAALLIDVKEGDEIIMPSYTFVSTANAFVLRGATIVFCDSRHNHPNIDEQKIESLITPKTKAIVPVHYAGVACNMDVIMDIAFRHNLFVIEDAAQAIDAYYTGKDGIKRALGSIGHLAAFSFHETKNIICGEGGMLVINDDKFADRAEIIREKGTNRSAFFRGEVDKYGWVDVGSSFLPSDIIAAFLYGQLQNLDSIQKRRNEIWHQYYTALQPLQTEGRCTIPVNPEYASNNGHAFYLVLENPEQRNRFIKFLQEHGITAVFHYLSLHKSDFYAGKKVTPKELPESDKYTDCLVRLPLFYELKNNQVAQVCNLVKKYFKHIESHLLQAAKAVTVVATLALQDVGFAAL